MILRLRVIFIKTPFYLIPAVPIFAFCILTGDAYSEDRSPNISFVTNAPSQIFSIDPIDQLNDEADEAEHSTALKAALAYAAKQREDRIRGVPLPPSQFAFPNVEGYPHHPRPDYVNFYAMRDPFPDYLLCEYDIKVKNYSQIGEQKWFKAALEQARHSGVKKFPPIKWIAVAICNKSEHKGESTFEQSYKVGAIFKASEVFDSSRKLSQLIAEATMDHHPFKYDATQATSGERQRWLIVETHATTNSIPPSVKK